MSEHDCTTRLITVDSGMQVLRRMPAIFATTGVALVMLVCTESANADIFGRWFFSPEERRVLDDKRDTGETKREKKTDPDKATAPPPVVDVISFDGKVERSDGVSTVWVNGRPVYTGDRTAEGIRVQTSRGTQGETRFELPPSDAGTTEFSLKAGQKVAVQNGRKFDAYERRPGEDAESVLDGKEPEESVKSPESDDSSEEGEAAGAVSPSPGG